MAADDRSAPRKNLAHALGHNIIQRDLLKQSLTQSLTQHTFLKSYFSCFVKKIMVVSWLALKNHSLNVFIINCIKMSVDNRGLYILASL